MKPETVKERLIRCDEAIRRNESRLSRTAKAITKLYDKRKRLQAWIVREKLKAANAKAATSARSFDFGGEA